MGGKAAPAESPGQGKSQSGIGEQLYDGLFRKQPKFWDSILYLVLLTAFTSIAIGAQGGRGGFNMSRQIRLLYSDFSRIRAVEDWWGFMEGKFTNLTFANQWYNGQPLPLRDLGMLNTQYLILGAVGLRQLRVLRKSCGVTPLLSSYTTDCYGEYSSQNADLSSYGPVAAGSVQPPFQYRTPQELGCSIGCTTSGFKRSYPGGGFTEVLLAPSTNSTMDTARTKIRTLKNMLWIDRQTRVVFVEFTVYDVTSDYLAILTMSLEMPVGGGLVPYVNVVTMKLQHLYPGVENPTFFVAEGVLLFAVLLSTFAELFSLFRLGRREFLRQNPWVWVDTANFILFYVAFGFRYQAFVNAAAIKFPPRFDEYLFLSPSGELISFWRGVLGVNSCITWIKLFKYFSHVPFMGQLVRIVDACLDNMVAFLLTYLVVFLGFAVAFYTSYSNDLDQWSTLTKTCYSLYRMILGDCDFEALITYNWLLGPLYFVAFTLLTVFVLLNLAVAIVLAGHEEASKTPDEAASEFVQRKADEITSRIVSLPSLLAGRGGVSAAGGAPGGQARAAANPDSSRSDAAQPPGDGGANDAALEAGWMDASGAAAGRSREPVPPEIEFTLRALIDLKRDVRALKASVKGHEELADAALGRRARIGLGLIE